MSQNSMSFGRARRRLGAGAGLAAILMLTPAFASAQTPEHKAPSPDAAKPVAAAPAAPDAAPADAPSAAAPAAPSPADIAKLFAALEEQKKVTDDQKKQLEETQKAVDDVQGKLDAASAAGDNDWTNKFKLYGFTDVGLDRVWVRDSSLVGNFLNSANATSFVIGNLNVYFDAQPVKGWRSLVEVRFTNAPQGEIASLGGLAGTFKRTSTEQTDPNASSSAMSMWGGYTVIERAHLDWTDLSYLKVRVGNWFTPFGIWNVDHGTPTLIATQMPEYIQLKLMPLRQTGIQVYGNTFSGDWELGYVATASNGRQELSNFAFNDDRGFGGRLYANNEKGEVSMKYGASFYTGRTKDQEVDLTSIQPFTVTKKSTFDYREYVGGLDASIDVGRTRVRAEGVVQSVQYDDGKHQISQFASATTAYMPNRISTSGYALVAHQLPWVPIEPYAMVGFLTSPGLGIGDSIVDPSVGINVRFNKSVMWKTQINHAMSFDLRGHGNASAISANNSTSLYSRLVLVF